MLTDDARITAVFDQYIKVICPYIIHYEILANSFPVEILNEIRAAFTHLAKYNLSSDRKTKEKNLSKLEGHIKRANLDCYKYLCIAFDDKYTEFSKQYRGVDLSLVDNGEFLGKLVQLRKAGIAQLLDARRSDIDINSDDGSSISGIYERYEKAFYSYSEVNDLIQESYHKFEHLKKRAQFKNYITIVSLALAVMGIIFGLIF